MQTEQILETPFWLVETAEIQVYLGRSVVVCKRACTSISELTQEEWEDLHNVMRQLENACKQGLGATMFNWTCLMNDAYKVSPAHPQVHWHFRPRYANVVELAGQTFADPNFGHQSDNDLEKNAPKASQELQKAIADTIRKHI